MNIKSSKHELYHRYVVSDYHINAASFEIFARHNTIMKKQSLVPNISEDVDRQVNQTIEKDHYSDNDFVFLIMKYLCRAF